jgi:hypothetical protein
MGSTVRPDKRNTTTTLAALAAFLLSSSAGAATHYYTVTVDDGLQTLDVEAHYDHSIDTITARSRSAGKYLSWVSGCGEDPEIRMRNRRMLLPQGGLSCVTYSVDLQAAAGEYRNSPNLARQNIVVSPSYWLWRPELGEETVIHIEFRLPNGVQVSVPWQPLDESGTRFELGRSPESAYAPAIFGEFDQRDLSVPGATLRVSLLQTDQPMDNDAIMDWVQTAASGISFAYGRYPNPSPQVVVIPITSSRSSSPVPFGRVIRDGGETVELFVNPSQPMDAFYVDWTATHEFSHLMLPYLHSEYRWISEGFAQYYQNILLARTGAYSEHEAWQKIYAGLERGRKSRPDLSPNDAASGSLWGARMKVYWSGAALALMADVALRERSDGRESLDTVLEQLQTCCLPSEIVWSGPEFYAQLDELAGEPVFMPLYRRYADTVGFPDTSEVFERLGLQVDGDEVSIEGRAELAHIREAMMTSGVPDGPWREPLSTN